MEKRFITAFILVFIFFMVYSYIGKQFFPQLSSPLTKTTLIKTDEAAQNKTKDNLVLSTQSPLPTAGLIVTQDKLQTVDLDIFSITYCATGGYIHNIKLKEFPDENILISNIGFIPADKNTEYIAETGRNYVKFTDKSGKTKEFIFDGYLLKIKLSHASTIMVFSNSLSDNKLEHNYQEIFYSQNGISERQPLRKSTQKLPYNVEFAGERNQYFCAGLIKGNYTINWIQDKKYNTSLIMSSPVNDITMYIGPQRYKELSQAGLESVIHYGFFHAIGDIIVKVFVFFHSLVKNWGISIILLAFIMYGVLFPFTMISTKAMKRMQDMQPEVEALKEKYKDNAQKLNQEIMELYKKNKINPLGGCLPLFFQFPVFIALYQVFLRFFELKGAQFLWIKDLSVPDHAFSFSFPAPFNYLNILPLLIMTVGIIQQRFTVSPSSGGDQKKMALFFSIFIGVIFYNFPSGMALYWFVQNTLTLLYQIRVAKSQSLPA